ALAGILTGAGYSRRETSPDLQGLFLFAIRVEDFVARELFTSQVAELGRHLKTSRLRPGCQEILLPGELEWRTERQRIQEGVLIDPFTWDQILKVKEDLGLESRQGKGGS
ncbi:MAG TPA: Ldh family oxidoreductase, partial [Candidatus Methylomirabilis sp.]